MSRLRINVNGIAYLVKKGEESKVTDGSAKWVEVDPELDALGGLLPGQHVQVSQILSYVEVPDEPAPDDV